MKLPLVLLAAGVPLALGAAAAADMPLSATGSSKNVTATLLSEVDSIQPGQTLWLGLKLQMAQGWHVYWKQAGDAGLPPRINWTLPPGFKAGAIAWPYPVRFEAGGITSYGYHDQVLLLVPVTAPPGAAAGSTVPLSAATNWLECREVCIPGKATLGLQLPVKAAPPASNPKTVALFKETRGLLPRLARGWTFEGSADRVFLRPPAAWKPPSTPVEFFAADDNVILFAAPQQADTAAGRWRLALKRDPNGALPRVLSGVLVARRGGAVEALDIEAKPQAVK
jgi:DsbC/DsbD-like thiol-disulfide interchange protein